MAPADDGVFPPSSGLGCISQAIALSAKIRLMRLGSAAPPVISIRDSRLLKLFSPLGHEVEKARDFPVEEIDVRRKSAARRRMPGDRAGTDGRHAHVADMARRIDRLPLRIEQILGAHHDEGLRLD